MNSNKIVHFLGSNTNQKVMNGMKIVHYTGNTVGVFLMHKQPFKGNN